MGQILNGKKSTNAKYNASFQYLTKWKGFPNEGAFEAQVDDVKKHDLHQFNFQRDLESFLGRVYGAGTPSSFCANVVK